VAERTRLTETDRRRVEAVFVEHQPFVEAIARRHAPSPDLVPDIVQAVGLRMCRSLSGFRQDSQLTTWLYRVTVNAARDCYRQEAKQARAAEAVGAEPEPDEFINVEGLIIRNRRVDRIRRAADRLKAHHRTIICDQLSDSPVLEVDKSRRYRAVQALRSVMRTDSDPGGE
jgi:RNA polymerase sigma-70 factor (ECF subfamily)